jgi:hypothetical protein
MVARIVHQVDLAVLEEVVELPVVVVLLEQLVKEMLVEILVVPVLVVAVVLVELDQEVLVELVELV